VTLPKPMTSGAKADGRLGEQDFAYLPEEDVYRCRAGERCRIAIQTKKTARCCGATGPPHVKIVRSNRSVRQGQSGESRDGSMSICLKPCSSALMQTRKPCVGVERQSSIVRHDEGPHGSDALPHQNASKSGR
jgi:hypothetical protein